MAIPQIVSGLASAYLGAGFDKEKASSAANAITEFSASSLVEFSGVARVEPITAIDSALIPYDFTTDVLKMLNSVFVGYYLTAGAMATNVGRVKTTQLLDKLNPSRSAAFNVANSILLNPSLEDNTNNTVNDSDLSEIIDASNTVMSIPKKLPVYSEESNAGFSGMRAGADLTTVANLSVGQMVTLSVSDGENSRDIPITVRLIAYPTPSKTMERILKWSEKDNSLKSRVSAWRAGELSFWRDLVFMRDIFAERLKALKQDKSGLFEAMTGRVAKNMVAGMMSMTPSLGTVSSIAVVSEDTIRNVEREIYGKVSDFKTRQRIMNATGIMLLAVVDPVHEFVTLYTYSIALPSEFSIKQIKSATKGSGPDISELIKLIQAGTPPSF